LSEQKKMAGHSV